MSKIDAIRDLEIKLRDMEAELGGVLDDLEEIRYFICTCLKFKMH